MTTYTITGEQLAAVRTQRKQLLDSPHKNDHAAATLLDWAETLQPAACAAPTDAASLGGTKTLASEHQGMRVAYSGLLSQCRAALREGSHSALAEMLCQLQGHLQELGRRWYAGDVAVVDELLQLYCVETEARAALKDAHSSGPEPVALTDLRAAFQKEFGPYGMSRNNEPGSDLDGYQDSHTQMAWRAAKFSYALAASQPAPVPDAWQVWWGLGEMRPHWPPFKTRGDAETHASMIKSNTEVRPMYAGAPIPAEGQEGGVR